MNESINPSGNRSCRADRNDVERERGPIRLLLNCSARLIAAAALGGTFLLAACADAPEPKPAAASPAPPVEGVAAFQRGDHVYLQNIGGEPRLLSRNTSWPRWSPDGTMIVAVRGREIVEFTLNGGGARVLARADDPRAVAWHPTGRQVFFTDGDRVRAVDRESLKDWTVARDYTFRELDVSPDGRRLVTTVRDFGVKIRMVDIRSGESRELADGCSASFSPGGEFVTNLLSGHRQIALLSPRDGSQLRVLDAPAGLEYDNQYWTNHPDWVAGESEGDRRDVILIHAGDGRVFRVTDVGDASRADVFIRG